MHKQLMALLALGAASCAPAMAQQSVARIWDEQIISAIRLDLPRPPVHARNLYHLSAAMYDAWAAYDVTAGQLFHHERATAADTEAARREAISYAAYRIIKHRYQNANGAATTLAALNAQMASLGYDVSFTSTTGDTPAALGNRVFTTIRAMGLLDGANESGNYAATNFYVASNPPLVFKLPGANMSDPNHWQPLAFDYLVLQNGIIVGQSVQTFVCPHWGFVASFGLTNPTADMVYLDPGPPAMLGDAVRDAEFKQNHLDVVRASSQMTPSDGVTVNLSPAVRGNNSLGNNDGTGYALNPVTGQPYAANVVARGDYLRCLSEFWADGPHSETPPGHWNVIANQVSDNPALVKCIGGTDSGAPVIDRLQWDVKLYVTINGALHDAAVACWGAKGFYDSPRPISAIRHMCQMGQSTNPSGPRYHVQGMPLEMGLVEQITAADVAPGGRFEHLVERNDLGVITNSHVGDIAIYAWRGQPATPATQIGGVGWILGTKWMPYQASTFVTPPFGGYYSGHSTYSRSAAEVLTAFTGSKFFPGGMGTYTFNPGYLSFEQGPSQSITLQWASYYDAADEAGISRIFGGIHPRMDDRAGRMVGSQVGTIAYRKARVTFKPCAADVAGLGGTSGGDGQISNDDVIVFLQAFFAGNRAVADIATVGGSRVPDGQLTADDVIVFLSSFFAGCS